MLFFWILIFILSLVVLVKSSDWLVISAEKIGIAFNISPFVIGITIVAIGTSLPELASSLAAVFKGVPKIVVADAVGSNITNILLIVGLSSILAHRLVVKHSLINLDSPLLAITTFLFIFVAWDKKIDFFEGILLVSGFLIYSLYIIFQNKIEKEPLEDLEILPSRVERRKEKVKIEKKEKKEKLNFKVFFLLILGTVGLFFGANYTIESITKIAAIIGISSSLIAVSALALGTSLPELVVSVRSAMKKKYEIALGNIFGSNSFNILLVVGLPALIKTLPVDPITFSIGIPFLIASTLFLIISGISRRIYLWEGAMYLLIYILFITKLFTPF